MLDILATLQMVVPLITTIEGIYTSATSNKSVVDEITALSKPVADLLHMIGSQFFPKADPAIAIVGGIIAAFNPNTTKWVQSSINLILADTEGFVPLAVDGLYGPKTKAAVMQLQIKLGLKDIDGLAGKLTTLAINTALANLPVLK